MCEVGQTVPPKENRRRESADEEVGFAWVLHGKTHSLCRTDFFVRGKQRIVASRYTDLKVIRIIK